MPSIEYQCRGCGHNFVRVGFLGDADSTGRCPKCRSADIRPSPVPERLFDGIANFSTLARDTS